MKDVSNLRQPSRIDEILRNTQDAGFAMASEPLACSILRTLAASKLGGRLLEIGSGTGLSTAWLLDGMDDSSTLLTVDNDPHVLSILNTHLGHDSRLTVVCRDGNDFLRSLPSKSFDLVFADTWSGKYQMLDEALNLVAPGGIYVVDDMLPQSNWPDGHALKVEALIANLESRTDFHVTKLSWASGIIIATKIAGHMRGIA
ncbi:MAG: methyltransferase domain-containing protein [Phormidesmis sp. RL_2_1]|nr:methyltransferase domain-containing protein [Phormidesmis sp. RL_2_1]